MFVATSKIIFVLGGVMSGVGKGITTAGIAATLKASGHSVTAMKIDPYLNVDAGTMNPTEHGEVFVTKDGLETDQDLGHYERFLNQDIPRSNYMTTGMVYRSVIERERRLGYGGDCVEVVPHITDEIEQRIVRVLSEQKPDFLLVEVGGTVGEYQNSVYLETARIMKLKWPGRVLFVLVSYFPIPQALGEMKTKPTQNAVRALNGVGIQPDLIVGRSSGSLDEVRKKKVSVFCNVRPQDIISAPDLVSIYDVPGQFAKEHVVERIHEKLEMPQTITDLSAWERLSETIHGDLPILRIGIVGKYFGSGDYVLRDSYISVLEALKHAGWGVGRSVSLEWLDAEKFQTITALEELSDYHGIVVPGGFGSRGIEGKINVIGYLRKNNIPFLGLCYGMQLAVVDFARNVMGLDRAHTTEIDPATPHPVITTMTDQVQNLKYGRVGGSMRLGQYACTLQKASLSRRAYKNDHIVERHRHRYEVNPEYVSQLEKNGLRIAGTNPESGLVEIIELPNHAFFVGTQFHPEFQSKPLAPHLLFEAFMSAASTQRVKNASAPLVTTKK